MADPMQGPVKIPTQDKIAELESRTSTLEDKVQRLEGLVEFKRSVHNWEGPIPPEAEVHWKSGWKHFDEAFDDFRQFFKKTFGKRGKANA
jgi:hypothetical protein